MSSVRAAIMPGTVQPKPRIIGIKDLPCSPMARMTRSMRKAARAYTRVFQQTDKEIQDNDKGHEAHNRTDTADDAVDDKGANLFVGNDAAKPVAKHAEQRVQPFLRIAPISITAVNIAHINARKIGMPNTRCVRTRSILSDNVSPVPTAMTE